MHELVKNENKEIKMSETKKHGMKKGLLKSLEALIAILMIMSVFLMFYGSAEEVPEFKGINWKLRGFAALEFLDSTNELRNLALRNDTAEIEKKLQPLMPGDVDYVVIVCGTTCDNPGVTSEELVSVSYLLAGNVSMFQPKQVVLYIW